VVAGKKKTDSAKASLLGNNDDGDVDDYENMPGQDGVRKVEFLGQEDIARLQHEVN